MKSGANKIMAASNSILVVIDRVHQLPGRTRELLPTFARALTAISTVSPLTRDLTQEGRA